MRRKNKMKYDMMSIIKSTDKFFKKLSKFLLIFLIRIIESALGCLLAFILLSYLIKEVW